MRFVLALLGLLALASGATADNLLTMGVSQGGAASSGSIVFGLVEAFHSGDSFTQPSGWTGGYDTGMPFGREMTSGYINIGGNTYTVTPVCSAIDGTTSTTAKCTAGVAIPSGKTIVALAALGDSSASPDTISDGTNSYTLFVQNTGGGAASIWYFLNPASVSIGAQITATWGTAHFSKFIGVYYLSTTATTGLTGNATSTSTTPSCSITGATYNPTGQSNVVWECVIASFK